MDDAVLVGQALKGDRDAFGALVERHEPVCFSIARRRLRDSDAAADAAQDAFLKAWEHLERLRRPEAFGAWVAAITLNICRSRLRRHSPEVASLDEMAAQGIEPADGGHPPEFEPELVAALKKALPRLPKKYRAVIELRYMDDWSCGRIAGARGLTVVNVTSRLFRGRKMLLKMLKREGWK